MIAVAAKGQIFVNSALMWVLTFVAYHVHSLI
uniref:Uncharacterized protein n=1 Tax=Arundo donax TaxID=35708 RepID=A0A0A9BEL2_ARUDO